MSKQTLKDVVARKRLAGDLDTNFIVEAGAGSGKTTVLIDRIVQTVKAGKCGIDRIAAVTFTRKAAAELRQRLQIALEEEQKKTPSAAVRQALADLDLCFTGTIHSFCSRMLRERPVEAGLDPDFEEIEDVEESLMSREAWESFLAELPQRDPGLLTELAGIGLVPADLESAYLRLVNFPEVEFPAGVVQLPDAKIVKSGIATLMGKVGKHVPAEEPEKGWDDVQTRLRLILRLMKVLDLEKFPTLMGLLQLLDRDFSTRRFILYKWGGKPIAEEVSSHLVEFRTRVAQPALTAWRAYRYRFVLKLAHDAAEYYHALRKRESRVNFQDLLLHTSRMLRDYPEVRSYFQTRFARLFVDEFQDTDPIQAEILFYLTGKEVLTKDWRKLSPRPGSLFVVGDPKQSIYRFRRADIDTYNIVKGLIKKSGGDELALTSNFRSDRSITGDLNKVFKEIFPLDGSDYQARFEPLEGTRSLDKKYATGIAKIVIRDLPDKTNSTAAAADADCIARYVRGALDGKLKIARTGNESGLNETPRPKDFMILLYQKRGMDEYARALESHGIPCETSGGSAFAESEDLAALLDLVDCINDPADPIAFFKTLRGKFFGVSDDLFYRYKLAEGRFSIFAEQPTDPDDEVKAIMLPAIARLKLYYEWSVDFPPAVALEKICEDLGVLAFTASGELANSTTGYVLRALDLAKISVHATSFAALAEYLEALLDGGGGEEASVSSAQTDAVRIMNLHKAKGLEAQVVFLANPTKYEIHEPTQRIERGKSEVRGYLAVTKKKGEFQTETLAEPEGWAKLQQEESLYEKAEKDRLQYVAATRARQLLVISVQEPDLKDWSWAPILGRLKDVRELDIPAPKSVTRKPSALALRDLEGVLRSSEANRQEVSKESYGTQTVTALVHKDAGAPGWVESGHGMGWGRAIHRILQLAAIAPPAHMDLLIKNVLEEQGLPAEKLAEVSGLIKGIFGSALWKRMQSSQDRQVEVPFSVKTTAVALGQKGAEEPFVLSGTVDLLFREPDGWVMVDYKTDTIVGDVKPFTDFYQGQLELYARFWSKVTGEPVKEKVFYFTSLQKEVAVS